MTAKEAVEISVAFAKDLYDERELEYLRVEEIERDGEEGAWHVTLGWVEPARTQLGGLAAMQAMSIERLPRVYKIFLVDERTGEVRGMRIRTV